MHVAPTDPAVSSLAQAGGGFRLPILAGDLKGLLPGELLSATVSSVGSGEAVLSLKGQTVTVRTASGLEPGATFLVRLTGGVTTPTLELVSRAPNASPESSARVGTNPGVNPDPLNPARAPSAPPAATNARSLPTTNAPGGTTTGSVGLSRITTGTPDTIRQGSVPSDPTPSAGSASQHAATTAASPTRASVALVDVLSAGQDGRVQVRIDGQTTVATTTEPLTPGSRYVLQVEQTPAGLTLSPPADTPNIPEITAAAILRGSPPPDLGAAVAPLLAELATIRASSTNSGDETTPLQAAADTVHQALQAILPSDGTPPTTAGLRSLVEDGGLQYEAKLARSAAETTTPPPAASSATQTDPSTAPRSASEAVPDLKDGLLRLIQAARDLGQAVQLPVAKQTLNGIEAQQAANMVAQTQGTPYVLQVPFPDGADWRTLHLAVDREPRNQSGDGGQDAGVRMLMHVPLSGLGETWIDAGVSGSRLRAVLYLESPTAQNQVRAELPGLESDLRASGFSEVLLDVRPADSLPLRQRQQAAAMQVGRSSGGSILDTTA